MRKPFLFLTITLLVITSFYGQKLEKKHHKAPISIYTFSSTTFDKNGFYAVNKKLNLMNFNFVFVDVIDNDLNTISLDIKNVYKSSSVYVYDDMNRYKNKNLLKGFLIKNDPTRWNLQCIENRVQPYFLNQ